MDLEIKEKIFDLWHARWDESVREDPVSEQDLADCERKYGDIPADYRWFLATCGSGFLSYKRLGSLISLADHFSFGNTAEFINGLLLKLGHNYFRSFFVVGIDYDQNFFVMLEDGRIVTFFLDDIESREFVEVSVFSESLEVFLIDGLTYYDTIGKAD